MKLLKKSIKLCLICSWVFLGSQVAAQTPRPDISLERQVVGSAGMSLNVRKIYGTGLNKGDTSFVHLDWTVGEASVGYFKSTNPILTVGFHQAVIDYVKPNLKDPMQIWPNPSTSYANVSYEIIDTAVDHHIDIRVVTILGQVSFSDSQDISHGVVKWTYVLNTSRYIPGIYIVSLIIDSGNRAAKKLLKLD